MSSVPDVLNLEELEAGRYEAAHPDNDPEGRNVVFSGQILAQMIMAADLSVEGAHDVKMLHAVFSRAGTYESPVTLQLDTTHAGRLFGSTTITVSQGGRLLSRGMALLNAYEDDFVRHGPVAPQAPAPDSLEPDTSFLGFPGSETRTVHDDDERSADGTPSMTFWLRAADHHVSVPVSQAVLAWSQPGALIGLALRPHSDAVSIEDAHTSLSTGVISHTVYFHERFDASDWLLVRQEATYTGRGRVYGTGNVYDRDGQLVSSFSQLSMVRGADRPMDPKRSM